MVQRFINKRHKKKIYIPVSALAYRFLLISVLLQLVLTIMNGGGGGVGGDGGIELKIMGTTL